MYKIAAVGDRMSVFGFRALGADVFFTDGGSAGTLLENCVSDGYAVIFITEPAAANCREKIEKYRDLPDVSVLIIPAVSGNTGIGRKRIDAAVEKAVGQKTV